MYVSPPCVIVHTLYVDGSHTTTSKTQLGKGSRKRKTESEDDPTQRKVRRRSLRGQSVKDHKQGAADEERDNIKSEGKPKGEQILWSCHKCKKG